jgi:hypothetical protein
MNQRNSSDAQGNCLLWSWVSCCGSSCSAGQTGMSRSCHFRLPSLIISVQPLYVARRPVRVSDQAKRIRNPTWRARCVLFTWCVSVQDTGGYDRHIFKGPHPLLTGDERNSRETPMAADARHDVAGRLQLLRHCWTVLPSAVILCHVRSQGARR